jgi:hypothetical protein
MRKKAERHTSYRGPAKGHAAYGGFRRISIAFDDEQINGLNRFAEETCRSVSAAVNQIVTNFLKRRGKAA